MLRPTCDPGERAAERHRFCTLYKLRCDCARCITPRARAEKEALDKALRSRGEP